MKDLEIFNSSPASGDFCCILMSFATVCTQIWTEGTLVLIWIQTVRHSDSFPERFFRKLLNLKNSLQVTAKTWKITQHAKIFKCDLITNIYTVLPAKSDSDAMLCLEWIDHLCINPIHRIGLIHKWSIYWR